jgi:hypothetical protein
LRYTDPSGYFWKKIKRGLSSFWKKNRRGFFKAMFGIVGYNSSTVRNIITGGACIMVPASCGAVTAANAYASGASTSDALKAGARGQIGAAIGQQVARATGGAYDAGTWQNVVGNGIGGGVQSRINGGSFRDGFVGAAFGAAFKPVGFKLFPYANQGLQRVITAGLVGGTGSYLSGGKFGYGAFSGAFGQYWNGEGSVIGNRCPGCVAVKLGDGKMYWIHKSEVANAHLASHSGANSIHDYNTTTGQEVAAAAGAISLATGVGSFVTGSATLAYASLFSAGAAVAGDTSALNILGVVTGAGGMVFKSVRIGAASDDLGRVIDSTGLSVGSSCMAVSCSSQ